MLLVAAFGLQEVAQAAPDGVFQAGPAGSAAAAKRVPFPTDPRDLQIPVQNLQVRSIHRGSGDRLIVLLQDAHTNFGAQENLSKALGFWLDRYRLNLVLSEGGSGDLSLVGARGAMPPADLKRAARRLLWEGLLTGHEFANLTLPQEFRIVGIEDESLYEENLLEFAGLVRERAAAVRELSLARAGIERLKNGIYPRDLLRYEQQRDAAGEGLGGLNTESLLELAQHAGIDVDQYPAILRLEQLKRREKRLDLRRANAEQAELMERLVRERGRANWTEIFEQAAQAQDPAQRSAALRAILRGARAQGIEIRRYAELRRYLGYLEAIGRLDLEDVLGQIRLLEEACYSEILKTPEDFTVHAVDRHVRILKKAYEIRLGNDDYQSYLGRRGQLTPISWQAFVNDRLAQQDAFDLWIPYQKSSETAESKIRRFYRTVSRRDRAFVDRALQAMEREGEKSAVLVTGGYHTEHLIELFRRRGVSVLTAAPHVAAETDAAKYEALVLASVSPSHLTPDGLMDAPAQSQDPNTRTLMPPLARSHLAAARMASRSAGLPEDARELLNRISDVILSARPGGARMAKSSDKLPKNYSNFKASEAYGFIRRLFQGDPMAEYSRDENGFIEVPEGQTMIGIQGGLQRANLRPDNPDETIEHQIRSGLSANPEERLNTRVHVREVTDEGERHALGVKNSDVRVHVFRFSSKNSLGIDGVSHLFTRSDERIYAHLGNELEYFQYRLFKGDPFHDRPRDDEGFMEAPECRSMIGRQGELRLSNLKPNNPNETIVAGQRISIPVDPKDRQDFAVHVKEVMDEAERYELGVMNPDIRVHLFRFSFKDSSGAARSIYIFTRSDADNYYQLKSVYQSFQKKLFLGEDMTGYARDEEGFIRAPQGQEMIGTDGAFLGSNPKPNNPSETIAFSQRISLPVDPGDRQGLAVHVKEVTDAAERYELGVMNPDIRVHLFRFSFKDSSGAARSIYIFTRSDADRYYDLTAVYQSFQKKLYLGEDMTGYARDEEGFIRVPQGQEMISSEGLTRALNLNPNDPDRALKFQCSIGLSHDSSERRDMTIHVKELDPEDIHFFKGHPKPSRSGKTHLFYARIKRSDGSAHRIHFFWNGKRFIAAKLSDHRTDPSNIHLLLAIGQALRTGDWSVIAEIYTRNLENIAVFWRHFYMMGVFLGGLSKEEAARVFKDPVLYLGTGPLDQSTALLIKTFEEQKLPLPSTIVLDRSLKMQKEASKRENEKGLRASFRLVGDFTRELPIEARSQSLVVAPSLTTLDSKTRNALMRNIQGVMKDRGYVILPADKAEIPQKTLDVLRDAGFALRRGPLQAEFSDAQRDMISRALSSSKAASAIVDKLHRIRSQFIILQFDEKSARPITADKSFEVVKVQEAKQESPYDDFEHHLRKKPRGVDLTQMDLSGMPDLFGFESAPKSSDADRDAQLIQWVADSTEDELVGKLMDDPRFADDPSAYLDKIQDALTRNPGLLSSLDATRRERVMRSVVLSLVFFLTSVKYEYYLKSEFKGFLDHKADPGAVTKQMLVDLLGQAPAATRIGTGTVKIARERIKKISSILTRPLGARLASEGGLAGEDEGREAIIASNVRRHRETTVPVEEAMSAEEIASVTRIVYPAAGGDDETIWLLAGIFPNVEEAVLIDPIYLGFEKDRSETIEGRTIRFRRTSADFLSWHPAAAGAAPRGGRTLVVDKGPGRNASLRDLPAYVPALMRTAGSDGWILSDQYMTPAGYPLRRAEHILGGGTLRSDRVSGRVRISDHPIRTWTLLKVQKPDAARLSGPVSDGGVVDAVKMPVRRIDGNQAVGVARHSRAEGIHSQMEEILGRLVKLVPGNLNFVIFKYFSDYERYIRARLNLTVVPMMYYWSVHPAAHWIYAYGLNALPDIILHELIHAMQTAPAKDLPPVMENLEKLFARFGEEGRPYLDLLRRWEKMFSMDPMYAQSSREKEFTAFLYQEFLVQRHPYRLKKVPSGSDAYYDNFFEANPASDSLHNTMSDLARAIIRMPDSRLRHDTLNHLRSYYRALHPEIPLPFADLKLVHADFEPLSLDPSRTKLIRFPSYGARLAEADPAAVLGRIAQAFGDFKPSGYEDLKAATAAAQVRLRHVNEDAPTAEGRMSPARALRTAREEIFKGRLRLLRMPEAERIGASRTRPAWQHPDLGIPPGTVVMRSTSQTMVTPEELNALPVLIYLGPNPWATGHYLLIAPDGELKSIWGDHLSHSDIYHRVNTPDPQEPLPRVQLGMALSQFTHAETAGDVFRALEIWERFSRPVERWNFMERELGLDVAYPVMASFYLTLAERVLALTASQTAQPHESEQRFVNRLPDFIGRASGFLVLAEERAQSIAESGWRQRLWDRIRSFIGYETRQQVFERLRERWLTVWEQRLESLMPLQEAEVRDDPMLRSLLFSVPVASERLTELVNAVEGLSGANRKDILASAKVFSNLIKTPGLDASKKQALHLAVEIALRFMTQMPPDSAPAAGPNGARLATMKSLRSLDHAEILAAYENAAISASLDHRTRRPQLPKLSEFGEQLPFFDSPDRKTLIEIAKAFNVSRDENDKILFYDHQEPLPEVSRTAEPSVPNLLAYVRMMGGMTSWQEMGEYFKIRSTRLKAIFEESGDLEYFQSQARQDKQQKNVIPLIFENPRYLKIKKAVEVLDSMDGFGSAREVYRGMGHETQFVALSNLFGNDGPEQLLQDINHNRDWMNRNRAAKLPLLRILDERTSKSWRRLIRALEDPQVRTFPTLSRILNHPELREDRVITAQALGEQLKGLDIKYLNQNRALKNKSRLPRPLHARTARVRERIVKSMERLGGIATVGEIAADLGLHDTTVIEAVRRMPWDRINSDRKQHHQSPLKIAHRSNEPQKKLASQIQKRNKIKFLHDLGAIIYADFIQHFPRSLRGSIRYRMVLPLLDASGVRVLGGSNLTVREKGVQNNILAAAKLIIESAPEDPAALQYYVQIGVMRAIHAASGFGSLRKPGLLRLQKNLEVVQEGRSDGLSTPEPKGARLAADEHFKKIQEMTRRIAAPPAPGESDGDRVRLVVELSEYLDGSGAVAIEGENALHIYTAFNQTQESDIPAVEEITQEHLDEMLAKKDPPELVAALTRLMRLIGAASPILTRRGERLNLALRGAAILALLHQDEGLRLTALQVLAGLPQDQTEDLIFMMRFMAAERSYGERMILEIVRFLESRGDVDGLHEIMLRPDARRVVRDRAVEALGAVAQKDDPEALAATETMIRELFNFDLDTDQVAGIMNALKDSRHPERAAPAIIAFMLLDEESELAQAAESTFSILAGHLDVHLGIKPPHAEAARLAAPQPTPEHGFAESAAAELEAVKDLAGRAEKRRVPAGDYAIALPQTRHSAVLRLGGGGAVLISPAGRQSVAVGTAESAAENDAPAVRAVYARILDSPEKRFVEHDLARYWSPADPDGRVLRAVVRELAKALEPLKDRVRVRFLFNGISILSLTADAALSESLIKSVQGSLNAYHVEELPQGRPAIQDLTNEDLEKPGTDGRGFVLSAQDPSDSAQDIEMRNPVLTLLAQIGLATGDSIQADDPVVALLRQLTRQPDFNHLDAEKLRIGDRAAVRSQRRRFSIKPLTAQLTETLIRIIRSTTAAALSA